MIPADTVEAAAKAIFEYIEDRSWETVSQLEAEFFRSAARMAILSGERLREDAK